MSGVQIFTNVGLNQNNLTGDAQGETASIGDNDKSLATTEFVQKIGLKFGDVIDATGAATLDSTHLGKAIRLTGSSPYTITIPDSALFLNGSTLSFSSHATATITINAAQNIVTKNGSATSINVALGDSFSLTKKSTGEWVLYGSWGAASGSFQPLNDTLTGISTLNPAQNGIPRKTVGETWVWDTSSYLTTNQNISISGDASGSGNTSISLTLANTGVSAGTYKSVTVDTKGRVTSGTNPTTLAEYGITDAVNTSLLASASGVATLDASGLLLTTQRPIASSSVLGMIKVGSNLSIDVDGILNFDSNLVLTGRTTGTGKFLFGNRINDANISNCWVDGVATGLTADRVFTMVDTTAVMKVVRVSSASDPSFELQSWDDTLTTCRGYWDVVVTNGNMEFRDRTSGTTSVFLLADRIADTISTTKTFSAANFTGSSSGVNTGDQTITLSGDVTGSGTGAITATLANSGVTAGTYNNVATQVRPFTVDSKGRITSIGTAVTVTPSFANITSKPTTLSGYGITDAQPLNNELTAFAALSDVAGYIRKTGDGTYIVDNTMPVLSTLASGQPAFVETIGSTLVSIEVFEFDFGLSSNGTRNVYLQFVDDIASSATVGQRLPSNMTLVGIYAQCTSVGNGGATAEVRVNGSGTASASCSLVQGTNIYNFTTHSINFAAGDRIAVYGAAPTNNWANMSVKLLFRWRD